MSADLSRSRLLVALLIVVAGIVLGAVIKRSGQATPSTLPDDPSAMLDAAAIVADAQAVPLRPPVTVAGQIVAARQVALAPAIAGRLAAVGRDVGQRLRAGDVAFTLDNRDARLAVENAEAQLAAATARARLADQRAERMSRLGQSQIAALDAVDQAMAERDVARAERDVARQRLAQAERERDKTEVTAPWDGVIVARHADPGAWVVPGESVLSLVDLRQPEVRLAVDAADAVHLRPGDPVAVEVPAVDRTLSGRVLHIAPRAGSDDLQLPLTVQIAETAGAPLSEGMLVEVTLDVSRAGEALAVPLEALDRRVDAFPPHDRGDPALVWRLGGQQADGRYEAVAQPVAVLDTRAGCAIVRIASRDPQAALDPGDRIVVAPRPDGRPTPATRVAIRRISPQALPCMP
ncbi:MAG: efflux RND transporter periplasmic adaptor subunit [Acidobacteriota bacterium]